MKKSVFFPKHRLKSVPPMQDQHLGSPVEQASACSFDFFSSLWQPAAAWQAANPPPLSTFRNAPGLRDTASREMRGVSIEHFGNLSQSSLREMFTQGLQKALHAVAHFGRIAVHFRIGA